MRLRFAAVRALVAIAIGVWASSASADGYLPPPVYTGPMVVPMFVSWTGFYVGGHIGGAWSDVDWANVDFTGERGVMNAAGFMGGVQFGYNQQFGKVLLGVEATYSGTTLNDGFVSVVDPNVTYNNNINDIITVTGRLGVALDRWLMYAKGGWAGAQVVVSGQDAATPDSFSFTDWRNGWTVGGGLEYKVARNISFGAEYGYIDLGTKTYSGTSANGVAVTVADHHAQIQSVTARLNFHFNHNE
jgi:outer membrane immunogenic protein